MTLTSHYTSTNTPSITATPTATPSSSETVTSTGTASSTPSASITLTPSASDTRTETATRTATPTASETATVSATRTISATITMSPTASPSPVPAPHQVRISVYNSAGEEVRLLFNGAAQFQPGQLGLDKSVIPGGAGSLGISFPGYLLNPNGGGTMSGLTWIADNDSGQQVAGGVYTIKAEIVDQFGTVTTLQQSVQVISVVAENSLFIYNSAGERVAQVWLPSSVGTGRFDSISLPLDNYGAQYDQSTGLIVANGGFEIQLKDELGHLSSVYWDGRNSQGVPVASGSYTAELVYNAPGAGGIRQVETKSFVVLQADKAVNLDGAYAYPNPALHSNELKVAYTPSLASSAVARLYSLNGELIAEAADVLQTGTLVFDIHQAASGVYLVKLEKQLGGATLVRTVLKVGIVR